MPRRPRQGTGGVVYHVLNRSVRGARLFEHDLDYEAFEAVIAEALLFQPMRVLHYCVMPNHWHFLLWPVNDDDLSAFMRWLTLTHTQRYHAARETVGSGPIYQGRFKSFPVQDDEHYLTVARYIERNPVRAGLVSMAALWRWGSLHRREKGDAEAMSILSEGPVPLPSGWSAWVDAPQSERDLAEIRQSVRRGRPFGGAAWQGSIAARLGLAPTLRPIGRPRQS